MTNSSQATSNCLFTFIKYIQKLEDLLEEDGFEIATTFVAKMISFNGEVITPILLKSLAHKNYKEVSEPAYKLIRLLLKMAQEPVEVSYIEVDVPENPSAKRPMVRKYGTKIDRAKERKE